MKKLMNKLFAGVLAFVMILGTIQWSDVVVAQAEETVTITFESGTGGKFSNSVYGLQYDYNDSKNLYSYADNPDSDYSEFATKRVYTVPKNAYIYLLGRNTEVISNDPSTSFVKGWKPNEGDGVYLTDYRMQVDKDVTFTAVWGTDGNTITWNPNGGIVEPQYFQYGESSVDSTEPISIMYSKNDSIWAPSCSNTNTELMLKEWNTKQDGSGEAYNSYLIDKNKINTDITLYAIWATRASVTWDLGEEGVFLDHGFSLDPQKRVHEYCYVGQNVYANTYFSQDVVPTDENKILIGWNTEKNATTVLEGDIVIPEDGIVFYPVWADKYTVTLDLNGGTWKDAETEDSYKTRGYASGKEITSGSDLVYQSNVELPSNPIVAPGNHKDKVLVGWTTIKDDASSLITYDNKLILDSDVTLYALWADATYIVCDANGGYFNNDETITSFSYKVQKQYSIASVTSYGMPVINNAHKTFAGYSLTKDGSAMPKNAFNKMIAQEDTLCLYAQWADAYTITFDANGGSYGNDYDNNGNLVTTKDSKVIKGSSIYDGNYGYIYINSNQIPTITPENKIFDGWKTIDGTVYSNEMVNYLIPTEDITLYAVWADAVNVITDMNGHGYSSNNQSVKVKAGEVLANSNLNYMGPDYTTFLGWSLEPFGEIVNTSLLVPTEGMHLYAQFSDQVNVNLYPGTGNRYYNSESQEYEDHISIRVYKDYFTIPTYYLQNENAGFLGLSKTENGELLDLSTYVPEEGDNLYIQWTNEDLCKVTMNAGDFNYSLFVKKNTTIPFLAKNDLQSGNYIVGKRINPYLMGYYKVQGWSLEEDGELIDTASYVVTKDTVLYRKTYEQPYSIYYMYDSTLDKPETEEEINHKAELLVNNSTGSGNVISEDSVKVPENSSVVVNAIEEVRDSEALSSVKDVVAGILDSATNQSATVTTMKLFDLNASGAGRVLVYIGQEYAGKTAVIGHFHNGVWSTQQCKVDGDGYVAPNFKSFSPIMVAITDTDEELDLSFAPAEEVYVEPADATSASSNASTQSAQTNEANTSNGGSASSTSTLATLSPAVTENGSLPMMYALLPVPAKNVVAVSTGNKGVSSEKVTTKADGTASVTSVKSKKKSVTVGATVVVNGVSYKVTSVGTSAFKNSKKAKTITLPSSVTKFEKGAFKGAKSLTTIKVKTKKVISVKKGAFSGLDTKNIAIKVSKKMSNKEYKKFEKSLKKAGFEGTLEKVL